MPNTPETLTYAERNRPAETGAGLVEYVLLLLAVALVALPALSTLGNSLNETLRDLAGGGSFSTMGGGGQEENPGDMDDAVGP